MSIRPPAGKESHRLGKNQMGNVLVQKRFMGHDKQTQYVIHDGSHSEQPSVKTFLEKSGKSEFSLEMRC